MQFQRTDDAIWQAVDAESQRQEEQLELIASENNASAEVIAAMGTALTNKYAEGYPNRRYYGGCEHVDTVEDIARDRLKQVFGADRANVQPHSGTQANVAALMAMLHAGDKVLAMDLDHGGHLSHGHPKNFSGEFYEFHGYGVEEDTGRIDMDRVRKMAQDIRPKLILAGASAYPRLIDFEAFGAIAKEVGALLLVDMAHIAGLVAGGMHPNPVPFADVVTMTTHKTLRGPRGGAIVCNDVEWLKKINTAVFPGGQGGPLMHVIAAKAIAFREALQPDFKVYAKNVVDNARVLSEGLMARGLRLVSGGTDNHLMLVDVTTKDLTGAQAEDLLHAVGLTCNKNLIPYDKQPPMHASGIRIGTAAITTRGLDEADMRTLANWIADVLEAPTDEALAARVRGEVLELTAAHPLYVGQAAACS
ncbi:MAG: serine hydroxymethyltransferase [Planctomycetota bacterium]|nr:serine hydroxymethyltransferase [Planctomycetota bacterium]